MSRRIRSGRNDAHAAKRAAPSLTSRTSKPSRRSRVASAIRAADSSSTIRILSNIDSVFFAPAITRDVTHPDRGPLDSRPGSVVVRLELPPLDKQMYPVPYFRTTRNRTSRTFGSPPIYQRQRRTIARGLMKRTLPTGFAAGNRHAARAGSQGISAALSRPISAERQPVHVVYGGAHLFRAGTTRRLGDLALRSLDEYAPDFATFAKAIGLPGADRLPAAPDTLHPSQNRSRRPAGRAAR